MQTYQRRKIIKASQRLKTDQEIARLMQLLDEIRQRRNQAVPIPQPHPATGN